MDSLNVSGHFILRSTWGYRNVTTNVYDGLVGDLQSGLAEFAGNILKRFYFWKNHNKFH